VSAACMKFPTLSPLIVSEIRYSVAEWTRNPEKLPTEQCKISQIV